MRRAEIVIEGLINCKYIDRDDPLNLNLTVPNFGKQSYLFVRRNSRVYWKLKLGREARVDARCLLFNRSFITDSRFYFNQIFHLERVPIASALKIVKPACAIRLKVFTSAVLTLALRFACFHMRFTTSCRFEK